MKTSWKDKIGRNRIYSPDFDGRSDVVLWDVLRISDSQLLKFTFLSTNSEYKQGIRVAVDVGKGFLEILGQKLKEINLWNDTAPREVTLKVTSDTGLISVYNIYDKGNGPRSQMNKSGMVLEEQGNKTIYHCNDFGDTEKFDKLVFSIEKI